jgi:transposase
VKKLDGNDPELFAKNSWILHHDNTPAHTVMSVREFLASKQITVLEDPPYSPDLAPSVFFLFPKIKEILKGRHFHDTDIRSRTMAALKVIPQNQFQNCSEGWTRRWHQCIASQWEYFEGDYSDIFSNEVCSTSEFANFIVRPRMWKVCLHEWLCGTGTIGVMPAGILCSDVYSAAVCWHGVELCVNILYGDYIRS